MLLLPCGKRLMGMLEVQVIEEAKTAVQRGRTRRRIRCPRGPQPARHQPRQHDRSQRTHPEQFRCPALPSASLGLQKDCKKRLRPVLTTAASEVLVPGYADASA